MARRSILPARAYTKTIRSKKRLVAERFFCAFGFLYYLFYFENNLIETTRFEYASPKIPRSLNGLKIVHISDLHGKSFGKCNRQLLARICAEAPGLIVITGDLIDERSPFPEFARETIAELTKIAPTFYTTGNHEARFIDGLREQTLTSVADAGGIILDDRLARVRRGENGAIEFAFISETDADFEEDAILLGGLPDPETELPSGICDEQERYARTRDFIVERLARLQALTSRRDVAFLLLSHRPEQIATYASRGVDLVFTGHAHGGQFRLPWILPNGLNAPHQGFFPKYTSGRYEYEGATEIVSRGLGPSVIPTRLFNRPNLVVCTLTSAPSVREQ